MFDNPELQKQILETIDVLDFLEHLMDKTSNSAIEEIMQQAWVKVRDTKITTTRY
ncbi:MAG: hypothetical protein IGS39_25865 [Calothrix sp. C42_A2020_038]|nr:hypothetical protein [Calothrix sp. C42_A2020_038]